MESNNKRRNRKKLMAFLVFIIVFGALIFFGYNNFVKPAPVAIKDSTGLNNKLPAATAPKELNKLEIYMQAEKDSLARKQEQDNDPNTKRFQTNVAREGIATTTGTKPKSFSLKNYTSKRSSLSPIKSETKNAEEDEIERKMRELNKIINQTNDQQKINEIKNPIQTGTSLTTPPVEPVPQQRESRGVDPELEKLDGMLDKLRDIQHPERVIDKLKDEIKPKDPPSNANKVSATVPNQTIQAVVHNTQTISNGSTIKLRLLTDVLVKEQTIPKGSFLFGIAMINSERLIVQLNNINHSNTVIPVSLSVYDIDGIEGIYIPGAVEREVSKEGADQAIQSVNLSNFNPTVSGQLTSAGIQATKSLLSKKARIIRVTVKAGHHILLQNTHSY
jgi:hypothetical protein